MKRHGIRMAALLAALGAMVLLAGCTNYVKKDDFNAAINELQQNQQQLQQKTDQLQNQIDGIKQTLSEYGAKLTQLEGRIRVDNVAYFQFDNSDLQDQYKPMLDAFAKTMAEHHADVLVTVEGFTDPAGSKAYNKRLGKARADAVRDYLVNQGGMSADKVRAVSYGEDKDRQVEKGETRAAGSGNRRATLVIDYTG